MHTSLFHARHFILHNGKLLLLMACLAFSASVVATPGERDSETIEYLIDYVRQSDMTFVRNFSRHTPGEAAGHIQDKYEHFHNRIETPEDFIDLCATESLMTGRDYLVIDAQGYQLRSRDWLMDALNAYLRQQSRSTEK